MTDRAIDKKRIGTTSDISLKDSVLTTNGFEVSDEGIALPHHSRSVSTLHARLIEAWSMRDQVHPLEKKDSLTTPAYLRTRYVTQSGLDRVKSKVGEDAFIVFEDMDNAGVLNDVGLSAVTDYLLQQKVLIVDKHLGKIGEQCRYAGDEFITILPFADENNEVLSLISEASAEYEILRKKILQGDLPQSLRADLGTHANGFHERIAEANALAILRKTIWGIRATFRADEEEVSSESLGQWLRNKISPEIFYSWTSRFITIPSNKVTFSELEDITGRSIEELAHSLQVFVAQSINEELTAGRSLEGFDEELVQVAKIVASRCKIMAASSSMVELRHGYTPYDFNRSIAVSEREIYHSKLYGQPLVTGIVKVDPDIKIKSHAQHEIVTEEGKVFSYNEVIRALGKDGLSQRERMSLHATAFRLICTDPSSDSVIRLSHVASFKMKQLLPIQDAEYYTIFQFRIEGFGAFNKGDGMAHADAVFGEIMQRFAEHCGNFDLKLRVKGGTGALFVKGNQRIDNDEKLKLEAKLTQFVQDHITAWTKLDFHERQAFRISVTRSPQFQFFCDRQYQPRELGYVKIDIAKGNMHGNQPMGEAYGALLGD